MALQEDDFTALYATHFARVFRLCKGYLNGDQATTQDLAQEVFIKVWQHRAEFRGESSPSTWIYRVAVNTCLLQLRQAATQRKTQMHLLIHQAQEAQEDQSQTTTEQLAQLYASIQQLDPAARLIILLVLDGVPHEEIAAIVGIAEPLLRVKIHRIKKRLTKLIHA